MSTDKELLRTFVFSAYDLQMLRMQTGLRLCANFRSKLKTKIPTPPPSDLGMPADDDLDDEAITMLKMLKESYGKLTEGVARNRTLPSEKGFKGDELISSYTELVLVDQYLSIVKNEQSQFRAFEKLLASFPIYTDYLQQVPGVGPAMGGVLITYFDIHKASYISDFWSYAGLDVVISPDGTGKGRSRREEHLIPRKYKDRNGEEKTRMSVTYNPWLKARLLGALATSFMRTPNCPWRLVYDNYKNRLLSDPRKQKVTLAEYKSLHKRDPEAATMVWPPLRFHRAALRYMVKQFLADFWIQWRTMEELPLTAPYAEAKLGMPPHSRPFDSMAGRASHAG